MNPPGWYADPQQPGMLRWWDGQTWTAHVRPAVDPAATAMPTAPSAGPPGAVGPAAARGDDDPTDAFVGGTFGEVFGAAPGAPAPGDTGGLTGGPPVAGDPFLGADPRPGPGDPYGGWAQPGDPSHPFGTPPPAPTDGRSTALLVMIAIAVAGLVALAGGVVALRAGSSTTGSATTTTTTRRSSSTTTEPVPSTTRRSSSSTTTDEPTDAALDRNAEAAGIPVLDSEGVATHTHTLVKMVFVGADGEEQEVLIDEGVGIDERGGQIAAVHTHSDDGVLHVESPRENDTYTLRQFLTLWTGETDPGAICEAIAGEPCTLSSSVVAPTASDRRVFETYGRLPDEPPAAEQGLDTELAQGLVIEVRLEPVPSGSN